jgi:hypothetical protein
MWVVSVTSVGGACTYLVGNSGAETVIWRRHVGEHCACITKYPFTLKESVTCNQRQLLRTVWKPAFESWRHWVLLLCNTFDESRVHITDPLAPANRRICGQTYVRKNSLRTILHIVIGARLCQPKIYRKIQLVLLLLNFTFITFSNRFQQQNVSW